MSDQHPEIEQEFLNAVERPDWNGLVQALECSGKLLQDTWTLDGRAVAEGIEKIQEETASMLQYNSEKPADKKMTWQKERSLHQWGFMSIREILHSGRR